MAKVKVFRQELKFAHSAITSRGIYRSRNVWFLVYYPQDDSAVHHIGEIAPLYDLSPEYHPRFEEEIISCAQSMEEISPATLLQDCRASSIRFALDCISRQNQSLPHAPFDEVSIPVNGLIWMGTKEQMTARMKEKLQAGFRCIKLKIGGIDFEEELSILQELRNLAGTDITIRLDANGAWQDYDTAMKRLEALAPFGIHSIEQPVLAGLTETSAKVCRQSPVPIALDEELIGIWSKQEREVLLATIRPQYLVLKPTLHGGLSGAEEWIRLAKQYAAGYWVTSALESNVGLRALAEWILPTRPLLAQGLGTGDLYLNNMPRNHRLHKGYFYLVSHSPYSVSDLKGSLPVYG